MEKFKANAFILGIVPTQIFNHLSLTQHEGLPTGHKKGQGVAGQMILGDGLRCGHTAGDMQGSAETAS